MRGCKLEDFKKKKTHVTSSLQARSVLGVDVRALTPGGGIEVYLPLADGGYKGYLARIKKNHTKYFVASPCASL